MQHQHVDDIDLRDLVLILWRNKVRLLICILFTTLIAAAYAFISAPTYEASSNILPPTPANLSSYNAVAQNVEKLPGMEAEGAYRIFLRPEDAYRIFLRHLNSGSLKLSFFDKYYLPEKIGDRKPSTNEREQLWKDFNSALGIALPTTNTPDLATVSLADHNPTIASTWVNDYIEMAMHASSEQALSTLTSTIDTRVQQLNIEIDGLRTVAEQDRVNRITRLKEDILLAKSIDLKAPSNSTNLIITYAGEAPTHTSDTAYLRGSLVLEAELALLKARENNDPYIEGLPILNEQLAVLKNLKPGDKLLRLAAIDNYAVVPETPVKPKKLLLILLGAVLGLILGVFGILVKEWWMRSALDRKAVNSL